MTIRISPQLLSGTVRVPASKSIAHRALICAALASGTSVLTNVTDSQDITATCNALTALGAEIIRTEPDTLTVRGITGSPTSSVLLDCQESGSTLRFVLPVAAALGCDTTFFGGGRLPYRPLTAYLRECGQKGITFSQTKPDGAILPLHMQGKLQAGLYELEGDVSSQYLSGLFFALPLLHGDSEVRLLSELESKPYVELTIDCLARFGVQIQKTETGYRIPGGQQYHAYTMAIDGDDSQAAFFFVANAIGNQVKISGLAEKSLQGDKKIVEIIENMCYTNSDRLHCFAVDATDIPDLVPILAVLACFGDQPSRIYGAKRLRLKESDRLHAIADVLNTLGAEVSETADGLLISPVSVLHGGTVDSYGDHRIVMSLAIAATRSKGDLTIRNADAVKKSYPTFFSDYEALGGKVHGISLE